MSDRTVRIERGGMQALIVDRGRFGLRDRGVPWCGAMDLCALSAANAVLGNDRNAAAIEATYGDLELILSAPARIALAGADCAATIDGRSVAPWKAFEAPAGARLHLRRPLDWVRTIVAFDGGIDVPPVLGSRTTDCTARIGGIGGRALQSGDAFVLAAPRESNAPSWFPAPQRSNELRVIPEPGYDALWGQSWKIGHESNRMGWRLYGNAASHDRSTEPRAVFPGVIQLPPSGEPIVLGSDAQTTGGYPIAGVVVEADLWMLAQIPHGGEIRFRCVSI
jgi:5-oxoprolinase (ATP-hydrolysing) subunit C